MFIDASFGKFSRSSGCGVVLYRANDEFAAARCWPTFANLVIGAEAQALLTAVEWAKELHIQNIIFISDNLTLVNGDPSNIPSTVLSYVQYCQNRISLLGTTVRKYVKHNLNEAVDTLARLAGKSGVNNVWHSHPPVCITDRLFSVL